LCNGDHTSDSPSNWETLWSFVCQPGERELWLAPGRPCETEYSRMGFRDGVLTRR
jgi:hypothetical protein